MHIDADLAGARAHHAAARLDKIIDIDQLAPYQFVRLFSQRIHSDKQLHSAAIIFDVREGQLSFRIKAANTSDNRHIDRCLCRGVSDSQRCISFLFTESRYGIGDSMRALGPRGKEHDSFVLKPSRLFQALKFQVV